MSETRNQRIDLYSNPEAYDALYASEYPHSAVASLIEDRKGSEADVLSAGCGTGLLFQKLEASTKVGIDKSPEMVEKASQRSDGEFRVVDLKAMDAEREFDVVEATGMVLNHLESRGELEKALENMIKALRPGGLLLADFFVGVNQGTVFESVTTGFGGEELVKRERFEEIGDERFEMHVEVETQDDADMEACIDLYITSRENLKRILRDSGLEYEFLNGFLGENAVLVEARPR